jgi:hypothetical protein
MAVAAEDVEYPQTEAFDGGVLKVHHPVVDSWPDLGGLCSRRSANKC